MATDLFFFSDKDQDIIANDDKFPFLGDSARNSLYFLLHSMRSKSRKIIQILGRKHLLTEQYK